MCPEGGNGSDSAAAKTGRQGGRGWIPVVVVFALIAAGYVGSSSPVWFVEPDGALYLGLARSLGRGTGYTFNGAPYFRQPPGFAAMLAPVHATAGLNFRALHAVVAASGVAALLALFALVRARDGGRAALAVVVLTAACNWFLSGAATRLRPEVPYTFFSLLALWYAERQARSGRWSIVRWLVVAVLGVLAISVHLVGVALIPALAGGALLARGEGRGARRRLAVAVLVGAICTAAAAVWLGLGTRQSHLASYAGRVRYPLTQKLARHCEMAHRRLAEWTAVPLSIRAKQTRPMTSPIPSPSIASTIGAEQVQWDPGVVAMIALVLPGLLAGLWRSRSCAEIYLPSFFVVSTLWWGTSDVERYVIPIVPLLFYFGYLSLRVWTAVPAGLIRLVARGRRGAKVAAFVQGFIMVILGLGVLASAGYNLVRGKRGAEPFTAASRTHAARRLQLWRDVASRVAQLPADAKVYPASEGTWALVHFFTERPVLDVTPARGDYAATVQSLLDTDADYLVHDPSAASQERFASLIKSFRLLFHQMYRSSETTLYRVDKERLRRVREAVGNP